MPLPLPPNPYRLQSVNAKRGIIAQFFYANGNVDLFFRSKSAAAKKCRRQKKRVALQRTGWTEYCGRFVGDKTQASVTPCHMIHKNIFAKRLTHSKLPLCLMDGLGEIGRASCRERRGGAGLVALRVGDDSEV